VEAPALVRARGSVVRSVIVAPWLALTHRLRETGGRYATA
jgi:hypothetical protein